MKIKELNAMREARLKALLERKPHASWHEMQEAVKAQAYSNGSRVLFYMDERHRLAKEIPKLGVIQKLARHTYDGREIYEVLVEETGITMEHPIYVVEVLKDEKETGP